MQTCAPARACACVCVCVRARTRVRVRAQARAQVRARVGARLYARVGARAGACVWGPSGCAPWDVMIPGPDIGRDTDTEKWRRQGESARTLGRRRRDVTSVAILGHGDAEAHVRMRHGNAATPGLQSRYRDLSPVTIAGHGNTKSHPRGIVALFVSPWPVTAEPFGLSHNCFWGGRETLAMCLAGSATSARA